MVDAEELAKCFDADQLRGYSPIRNFTREERRVIAYALRQVRADTPARGQVDGPRWEIGKNGWDASDEITREDI